MIFKAFEINKINLSKYNLYLFYGENEGYKNEIIKNKFEILYTNQIYKYDEKEINEDSLIKLIKDDKKLDKFIKNKKIARSIFIKNKLINLIIKE